MSVLEPGTADGWPRGGRCWVRMGGPSAFYGREMRGVAAVGTGVRSASRERPGRDP